MSEEDVRELKAKEEYLHSIKSNLDQAYALFEKASSPLNEIHIEGISLLLAEVKAWVYYVASVTQDPSYIDLYFNAARDDAKEKFQDHRAQSTAVAAQAN